MGSNIIEDKKMHKGAVASRKRRAEVKAFLAQEQDRLAAEVDATFPKYDTDANGSLNREETRDLIADLTADVGPRLSFSLLFFGCNFCETFCQNRCLS